MHSTTNKCAPGPVKRNSYNITQITQQHPAYITVGVYVHPNKQKKHIRTLEKCFLPLSSRVGGGFCSVMSSTFMGGNLAKGAWPWAISRSEMPTDQMSAEKLYLRRTHRSGGGQNQLSITGVLVSLQCTIWAYITCGVYTFT